MEETIVQQNTPEKAESKNASTGKRFEWVDLVKYFCIMMVMLSHLESRTDLWTTFYSPFFLTAFLFVSGYVYRPKRKFGSFLYKKFRQLFVPWLVFSVLNIVLSQIISFNEQGSLWDELKWNFLQIRGSGDEIWFVAALFVAFVPFYFIVKGYEFFRAKENVRGGILVLVAVAIVWILALASTLYSRLMPSDLFPWGRNALPWHLEYVFTANFFMFLGYIFRQEWEKLLDAINHWWTTLLVWIAYLLLVYLPFFLQAEFLIALDIAYDYVCELLGITAIVMTAKVIKSNRYFNYVGQNTLIYFAFHGKVYSLIQMLLHRFAGGIYATILGNVALSSIFALCFALLISVILIIPAYIINRWLPFLVGRPCKKKIRQKGTEQDTASSDKKLNNE